MAAETTTEKTRRRLIPVEEVGAYITGESKDSRPLSRSSTYRLIDAGKLHKVNIGRRSFVTAASIDEYVAFLIEGGAAGPQGSA